MIFASVLPDLDISPARLIIWISIFVVINAAMSIALAQRGQQGALLADADPGLDVVRGDRREPDDLERLVDEVVAEVLRAVAELRSGSLQPRPATCAWGGGCSYPMICRSEA